MKFKVFGQEIVVNIFDITKSIIVVLLVLYVYSNLNTLTNYLDNRHTSLSSTEIERVTSNIINARIAENNKKFEDLLKELKKSNEYALKIAEANGKKLSEIGKVSASVGGNSASVSGDHYTDADTEKEFYDTIVYAKTSDNDELPIARVFFSPNSKDDKWAYQSFPIDYHTLIVTSKDKEGVTNKTVEVWAENNFVSTTKGKKFKLKLKDIEWVSKEPNTKEFMFNPRLSFGGSFSTDYITSSIGMSFFSYGKTRRDMDWTFLEISLDLDKSDVGVGVTPVNYNIGNFIPLVENIFAGPGVRYSFDEYDYTYYFGLKIPF